MRAADIVALLKGRRFFISDEKSVQRQLGVALVALPFEAEAIVANGRIDFLERPRGLGIEVKVKGAISARVIYRQLEGYAEDPRIDELLLITSKACRMPATIRGKPVSVFSLGRAHL